MRAHWSLVGKTRSVRAAVSVLTCRLLHTYRLFYGVTDSTPALLPASTKTSAFFFTRHTAYASRCRLQAEWQWLTVKKVDRNDGHNLEADTDNWRIDGKMHRKSKLSFSLRKTWKKWSNKFQTGCPEGLWHLLLWRYSKPTWTWSCAACCRWHCFSRGVGPDDLQRSLPAPNILWFCDSVKQESHAYETWQASPSHASFYLTINLVLGKGILLPVPEILLICKAGACIPGRDQGSYCSRHLH